MKIKKYFLKDKNLCLKNPRIQVLEIVHLVLREEGISCSYSFLGICEAIFRGRDLIFGVEPRISIYFKDIKYFFLIWTIWSLLQDVQLNYFQCFYLQFWSWTSWSRLQVVQIKKILDIRKIYTDLRFHTKNQVSTPKKGFTDPYERITA